MPNEAQESREPSPFELSPRVAVCAALAAAWLAVSSWAWGAGSIVTDAAKALAFLPVIGLALGFARRRLQTFALTFCAACAPPAGLWLATVAWHPHERSLLGLLGVAFPLAGLWALAQLWREGKIARWSLLLLVPVYLGAAAILMMLTLIFACGGVMS